MIKIKKILFHLSLQKTFYHTHTTQLCSEEDKDKEEDNNII
jgi:hypothetical protein